MKEVLEFFSTSPSKVDLYAVDKLPMELPVAWVFCRTLWTRLLATGIVLMKNTQTWIQVGHGIQQAPLQYCLPVTFAHGIGSIW